MNKFINHNCHDELRDATLKVTPARLAVLDFLEKADEPIDVSSVISYLDAKGIEADQATVFRIINAFTKKGITRQLQFNEGKFRYELASLGDHHHLLCERCGSIEDISDCSIEDLEKDILKKKGFKVKHHSLEFFGLCAKCRDIRSSDNLIF